MRLVDAILFGFIAAAPAAAQGIDTVRFVSSRDYDNLPARVQESPGPQGARRYGYARRVGPVFEIDTGANTPLTVARGRQFAIDIRVGHRRAAGAIIGATAGLGMMIHAYSTCRNGRPCFYCTYDGCDLLPITAPFVVGVGAAVGTVIGWAVPHWARVRAK
jgi:hypothetical protein